MKVIEERQHQSGYALLMAMAVLFGMLSLVLPLALMNRDQQTISSDVLRDAQAKWITESGRNLARYVTSQTSGSLGRSRVQRQMVLPGWQDIPLKLRLDGSGVSNSGVVVKNILPFFLLFASSINSNGAEITLGSGGMDFNNNGAPSLTETGGTMNDTYIIVGNELMRGSVNGTGINISARGLGGERSTHSPGEPVYVLPNDVRLGYLRVRGEWMEFNGHSVSNNTFTISQRGYAGSTKTTTAADMDIVEYYPVFPNLQAGTLSGYVRVQVEDEYGKINLNSLSKQMRSNLLNHAGAMGFHDKYRDFMTSSGSKTPYGYPLIHPDSLFQAVYYNGGSSFNSNTYRPFLYSVTTTYSEPDYSYAREAVSPLLPGAASYPPGNWGDELLRRNDPNMAWGTTGQYRVLQHPVNFNIASVSVMAMVLQGLGGMNQTQAVTLANEIDKYRAGANGSDPVDYMDGLENPFDGLSAGASFGSARAEFMVYIATRVAANVANAIYKHVYHEHYTSYISQPVITTPITFETGKVKTARSTVGISVANVPSVTHSETNVFKEITGSVATGTPNTYKVALDDVHGWNETMSTFFGVTSVSPTIEGAGAGTITFSSGFGMHVGGHMLGRVNGSSFELNGKQSKTLTTAIFGCIPDISGVMAGLSTTNKSKVNFGMHLTVRSSYIDQAGAGQILSVAPPSFTAAVAPPAGTPTSGTLTVTDDVTGGFVAHATYTGLAGAVFTGVSVTQPGGEPLATWLTSFSNSTKKFELLAFDIPPQTHPDKIVGMGNPFYETVLIRDGATWTNIAWDVVGAPITLSVRDTYNGSATAFTQATGTGTGSWNINNVAKDVLYLRATFDSSPPDSLRSPQLFSLKVTYTLPAGTRSSVLLSHR